jgi:hypothetical protein
LVSNNPGMGQQSTLAQHDTTAAPHDNSVAQDPRRPVARLHDSINSGSYVAAPHSHSQLMWGPQEHGMVATIMCPGSSQ